MDAKQIYQNHFSAFERGEIEPMAGPEQKFETRQEFKQALLNGVIVPELMRRSIEAVYTVSGQMMLYAIKDLKNSPKQPKLKKVFIKALNEINII